MNKMAGEVRISMNMMATVGASTWAVSSLPVSRLEVDKIGVAMTCNVRG